MSTEIKVTAALDAALRRAFSEAGVRVAPSGTMTAVVAAFNGMGISAEVQDGCLVLKQDTREFNVALACKAFAAKPENAALFVTEQNPASEWTGKQKSDFIAQHGYDAWQRKISGPRLAPGVKVLDQNMSRKDYESLTRAERVQFISAFGAGAVAHIMGKRA